MILTGRDRLILLSPVAVVGFLAIGPVFEDGQTMCPFALGTGLACPGCGMTRAASMLFRGDFAAAVTLHPLIPMIALLAVGGWVWFALRKAGMVPPMSSRLLNGMLIVTLAALVLVWVARLLAGTLPPV